MSTTFLNNALIVTGAASFKGGLAIDGEKIAGIWEGSREDFPQEADVIDLEGKVLMAGGIDAHVHFRDPGLTWKADIGSESEAALLGGITSFMDMPNTSPPTVSMEALEGKLRTASEKSLCNYGFHLGATDSNAGTIKEYLSRGLGSRFAGIKVFMGSSTGGMLVDSDEALEGIFSIKSKPVLVHCEDEDTIRGNLEKCKEAFGDGIPFRLHPAIRSREACIKSTSKAVGIAVKAGTALHVLHVSTEEEIEMIRKAKVLNPRITAETSANYLWFCDEDYDRLQGRVKCNPSIKSKSDREALRQALAEGIIDTVGSDHAPHLLSEKTAPYLKCPSGIPSLRESLPVLMTLAGKGLITLERVASAFSERAAEIFGLEDRGFLRPGCHADLVVFDPGKETRPQGSGYKCGWSPYEGETLSGAVQMVWINGSLAVSDGRLCAGTALSRPRQLQFRPIG